MSDAKAGSNPREEAVRKQIHDVESIAKRAKRNGDHLLGDALVHAAEQMRKRVAAHAKKTAPPRKFARPPAMEPPAVVPVVDERERELREHQHRTARRRRAARSLTGEEHRS